MNINKLRKTIEQLKESLSEETNVCTCSFVEITQDALPSPESLAIIEANQKCRMHDRKHVGYSYVNVFQINTQNESEMLIN